MTHQADNNEQSTLAEVLPTGKISDGWAYLLKRIRCEGSAEERQRQFQFAHGYLRALVDADLLSNAVLPELRELLIKAAAGHG